MDLNYKLFKAPDVLMRTYDFIGQNPSESYYTENYMFASIPSHPILENTLERVKRNLYDPPEYVKLNQAETKYTKRGDVDVMTYIPIIYSYFSKANKKTKDFIIPKFTPKKVMDEMKKHDIIDFEKYEKFTTCKNSLMEQIRSEISELGICYEHNIGSDSESGESWIN